MPKIFTIYHNPNFTDHFRRTVILANCVAVATVEIPSNIIDSIAALEYVFEQGNSANHPFWQNPGVTLLGGIAGARSLSSGDLVVTDAGTVWLCANCGWVGLDEHNLNVPLRLARHDAVMADEWVRMGHKPAITWPQGKPVKHDPRWTRIIVTFEREFLIGDYPNGKDRLGYRWQGHKNWPHYLIYWPDTGKCWVMNPGVLNTPVYVVSNITEAKRLTRNLTYGTTVSAV